MQEKSRINSSIRNIKFSFLNQIITLIFSFVVRTVFIKILGAEYLGVNGLFGNISVLLSIMDLGMTSAISYSLYKPIIDKNESKIRILMNFYSKIYSSIGLATFIIGISLMPFLKYIIKGSVNVNNLSFIYFLFVINAALGYFLVHKRTLIISDQKNFVIMKISSVFSVCLSIMQIMVLVFFQNYIFYLLSNIIIKIAQSLYISHMCNKLYPFLKEKTKEKLEKEDKTKLKNDVSALFLNKIGDVIANGTANIVISSLLGIKWVGLYSNYVLISNSINGILYYIFDGLSASIGNLVAERDNYKSYFLFKVTNFMNFWLYGVCSICICILVNPFINIWLGQEYLLSQMFVIVISINFYITGMLNAPSNFRNAYGLFFKGRLVPIIMAVINLVLSIILVNILGISGVFISSTISILATKTWYDPYILHRIGFRESFKPYVYKNMLYTVAVIITAGITYFLISLFPTSSLVFLLIKAINVFVISNILFLIFFYRTKEFRYIYQLLSNFIKSRLKK